MMAILYFILTASKILASVSPFFLLCGLLVFGFLTFGTGSFDVVDNGLMNTMLGPELSRPLVQSLHACVAIGFVMGMYCNDPAITDI
jgi:hypothetical protein